MLVVTLELLFVEFSCVGYVRFKNVGLVLVGVLVRLHC